MRIEIADPARAELFSAARRYDDENPGLGDEFLVAVIDVAARFGNQPTWPVWPGIRQSNPPVRRYIMERFPYAIGFQVFDDHVLVVAIAHAKRRPGYWR